MHAVAACPMRSCMTERLCCFLFPVGIAHYMDNMETPIKKQIQNELVRSRNSMIKEIRRELFEKMTFAMRSQGV